MIIGQSINKRLVKGKVIYIVLVIIITTSCISLYAYVRFHAIHYVNGNEIRTDFLITPDKEIIYASNELGYNALFKISRKGEHQFMPNMSGVVYPFIYNGEITGLADFNGNEEFFPLDLNLRELLANSINKLFSFNNGRILVYQFKGGKNVYIFNVDLKKKEVLLNNVKTLHSVRMPEHGNFIVVNYDKELIYIDLLNTTNEIVIATNSEGSKMNPFVFNDSIFFVNNDNSEYFQLYSIDVHRNLKAPNVILSTGHDIKLPKYNGRDLFYIEVIKNQYLLRKTRIETIHEMTEVTKCGVVFNYDFRDNNHVVIVYSDLLTPKSLLEYDLRSNTLTSLMPTQHPKIALSCEIEEEGLKSQGYIIRRQLKQSKGVILFIHPGNDYSPRWDPILMNIANNGYIIAAPNYPTSFGQGKTYYNLSPADAKKDILAWKQFLSDKYSQLPLFILTYSSGNPLLEHVISQDQTDFEAGISLFGIPSPINYDMDHCPVLYMLGVNDSRIAYKRRRAYINSIGKDLVTFDNEGHMFQSNENLKKAVIKIVRYLN